MFRLLLIIFLFLVTVLPARATHIIGGYLSYTHLSGNMYQIHLVVYRDCLNGVPPFDDPAHITIYDGNGNVYTLMHPPVFDSSDVFVQGSCIPGNVCIRKANYYVTIPLALNDGPFTFAYQRCCRSLSVLNIVDPGDFGMTFFNVIDETIPNSAPVYNHEFAAFTYVGDNFSFDAGATDPDGDVLVYSLEGAYDGSSQTMPAPMTASPPPYNLLVWAPSYSQSNMLGGPDPLTIDPASGLMTAVPDAMGVYVIGQKIEEYRNGVLIATSRREFVIAVNPGTYADGEGTIQADNGTVPLDAGKSWLIRKNLLDSTLTAVDTVPVGNGNFLHSQAINGIYLVKGSADSASAYYSANLPTYFGNVLWWYDATEIDFCSGNVSGINIDLVQGINPGGPGFIGGLISQGANRIMSPAANLEGITVILFDQLNQPVAYALTDVNGNFGIGNLPLGDYKVYVDRLNYYVDNSLAPVITINGTTPVINNLSFLLHDTWLEHNGSVGLAHSVIEKTFKVYPNPVSTVLTINDEKGLNESEYIIYDVYGKIIQSGIYMNGISVTSLAAQVYFLQLSGSNGMEYTKFVKH